MGPAYSVADAHADNATSRRTRTLGRHKIQSKPSLHAPKEKRGRRREAERARALRMNTLPPSSSLVLGADGQKWLRAAIREYRCAGRRRGAQAAPVPRGSALTAAELRTRKSHGTGSRFPSGKDRKRQSDFVMAGLKASDRSFETLCPRSSVGGGGAAQWENDGRPTPLHCLIQLTVARANDSNCRERRRSHLTGGPRPDGRPPARNVWLLVVPCPLLSLRKKI